MTNVAKINKIREIQNTFSGTPMYRLQCKYQNTECTIFAKYEIPTFSGSVKDRIALHIMHDAYSANKISQSDTILEVTSGNTGIAFASIAKYLGHNVQIVMPDWLSAERYQVMNALGVEIIKVSRSEGGFLQSLSIAEKLEKSGGYFYPRQFENNLNVDAHAQYTAREFFESLGHNNNNIRAFVAGTGTGGTVMGFKKYANLHGITCSMHPLEPANSPTLSTGGKKIGTHRIQGIMDDFIPPILKLNELDSIVSVEDGDGILMAQKINNLGISVGISAGANLVGAIKIAANLGNNAAVGTILCDSNLKYLSTDLCKKEPIRSDYLTPEIEILDVSCFI